MWPMKRPVKARHWRGATFSRSCTLCVLTI